MTTYYVKTDGNDGLSGLSWINAWLTINKAAVTAAAGDTVVFAGGTYNIPSGEDGWNSGTSGNIITFRSSTWRSATWLQTGDPGNHLIDLEGVDYIDLQALIIQGDQEYGLSNHIFMKNSGHITLDDCEIFDGGHKGIYMQGGCTYIVIRDCKIHPEEYDQGVCDGIEITSSGNHHIDILDTEIYHTDHGGINVVIGEDITITRCHIHDTASHCIGLHAAVRCEISYCQIHDADPSDWGNGGSWHNGIRVSSYVAGEVGAEDINIHHNDIYYNQVAGIYVRQDAKGPIDIYHNVFYGNNKHPNNNSGQWDAGSIRLDFYSGVTDRDPIVRIKNNIVYVTQDGRWTCYWDSQFENNLDADYNLYYAAGATQTIRRNGVTYTTYAAYKAAGYELHTVIGDNPDFNDAGNADFTLQSGSPAIDAGIEV